MSYKIVIQPGQSNPPVVHPSASRIWENCRGGPYKYGAPILVNAESLARISYRHDKSL